LTRIGSFFDLCVIAIGGLTTLQQYLAHPEQLAKHIQRSSQAVSIGTGKEVGDPSLAQVGQIIVFDALREMVTTWSSFRS
jgi:hypothetical protein